MGGLCQLCELRILYGTAGIELGKRRWGKRRQICQSNNSVVNRMLVLTMIDLITVETPSAVDFHSPSLIEINRDSRSRYSLVEIRMSSKGS
jgi:hypothetical protein